MASLVTFAKKLWKDATSGGTPITAAELNRMEGGINDCATQINRLGDSVCRTSDGITANVELNSQNLPSFGFRCGATRITVNFLNDRILVFNETESKHVAVFKKDE